MNEIEPNTIEQSQVLFHALTNQDTHLTASADDVIQALKAGESDLLVEVPWGEVHGGERHDRHQVILTRLDGARVYFINALKSHQPAGTVLEGEGKGPQRRVESTGEESMELTRFVALFAQGGKAMLTGK